MKPPSWTLTNEIVDFTLAASGVVVVHLGALGHPLHAADGLLRHQGGTRRLEHVENVLLEAQAVDLGRLPCRPGTAVQSLLVPPPDEIRLHLHPATTLTPLTAEQKTSR